MDRRQFIKYAGAAASAPLLPLRFAHGASLSPAVYAQATNFVSSGAYISTDYLKSTLGLGDRMGDLVVARLKADGLVGTMGKSNLLFSKTYYPKAIETASTALRFGQVATSAAQKSDALEGIREAIDDVLSDMDDKLVLDELEQEPSSIDLGELTAEQELSDMAMDGHEDAALESETTQDTDMSS